MKISKAFSPYYRNFNLASQAALSVAYAPSVGRVCAAIHKYPELVYKLTIKGNTVAIVTDGSAVLGVGQYWYRGRVAGDGMKK